MKEIMHRASSKIEEDVASFEFNPTEARSQAHQLPLPIFDEEFHPLNGLEQAFETHHIGKPYIQKNYREAFRNLEIRGEIVAEVPADKRKKRKGQLTINGVPFTFPYGPKKIL